MSYIDGFVVFKGVIADFTEFVSVKVGAQLLRCAVGPVLSVPDFWGIINCFERDGTVEEFFPQFVICNFFVDRGECIVK